MIRNLLAVLILCAAASGSVTVHAVLTDGTGTVSKTAFLRFELQKCGANIPSARATGKAAIQTNFDLRPNQVDGSIVYTNLFGNDEIQCGGVFSTYWFVTVMKDQTHPLRDGLSYVLLSGTTFDPAVTPVMSVQQPAPAPPPLCCVSPLQGGSAGSNPGGGPVTFQLPCPTNVVPGANGYSTGNGGFNCDPLFVDDGVGNWTSQSGRTIGPVNGFLGLSGGSASPGSDVKYKLGANEFRWLARTGTSEYTVPPATLCTPGQVWGVLSSGTDGNGDTVQIMQCQNSGAGAVTSVGLELPAIFTVTNSPVTTAGTLTGTFNAPGADYLPTSTAANTVDWKQVNGGVTCGDSTHATSYNATTHLFGCQAILTGGSANALLYPDYCVPDVSGNVGWTVTGLTNIRFGNWTWIYTAAFGGTDTLLYCAFKIPHVLPSGVPKLILETSTNDAVAGHTMTFKECDILETTSVNVGTVSSCSSTSNFTTTSTAYAPTISVIAIQATPSIDNILNVVIHATAESGLGTNVLMRTPKLEYE